VYYGRYKIIPIRNEIIRFCETMGFDYMGGIIWQKITTCNTSGGAIIMGSYPYPRNGIIKLDYETILIFKKPGAGPAVPKETKPQSKLSRAEWNEYFKGHWQFPGDRQDKHLAVFPEELPRRLVRMFSFVGETVLDPFLGSGTTALAARNTGRDSIGYEINADALPIMKRKLGMEGLMLEHRFRVVEQAASLCATGRERWSKLPYLFQDPVAVMKKMDPRTQDFGSKIVARRQRNEDLETVREVVSPKDLLLASGRTVRLIGIRENGVNNRDAIAFLEKLTRNQKVMLRYDKGLNAADGAPIPCYLYLKNKTFVNAHLIKSGFVDVDTSFAYEKREKFIDYLRIGSAADRLPG
jgi:site-specific DNA-methyltransferase (adenine-specific)